MSIIYSLKDSNRYVYHYTDADKALNYILKDRTLLLNSFSATNDPKESKEWNIEFFARTPFIDDDFISSRLDAKVAAKLKSSVYLSCFCSDLSGLTGDHTQDILKRGLAKPRMWAQYADKHKGFCLIFEKEILIKKIEEQFSGRSIFHRRVSYIDRTWTDRTVRNAFSVDYDLLRRIGIDECCRLHIEQYVDELYFDKLQDWRDEQEWRIVLVDQNGPPSLLEFGEALVGVVHGDSTPIADTERAIELCSEPHIERMGLKWNNHFPWYDLGNGIWYMR